MSYPKDFNANRDGTFTLNGLQFGIADLNYHAMNDNGVYEGILNVRRLAGTYDFNSHLEMMRLESVKLENCGCLVDKSKKVTIKQTDYFNPSMYPGIIFLSNEELEELLRIEKDTVALEKMLKFLNIKNGGAKPQLLKEFGMYKNYLKSKK